MCPKCKKITLRSFKPKIATTPFVVASFSSVQNFDKPLVHWSFSLTHSLFVFNLFLILTVHPEVAEILRKSKGRLVDGKWHKPLYNARALAALRNEYIAKGFYWPERPMRDRGLDRTPKGHKRAIRKEERWVIIFFMNPLHSNISMHILHTVL